MPLITPAEMAVVADLLNNHAPKLTDSDKGMVMDIGMAYKEAQDVEQDTYDSLKARILLIKSVVEHV